MKKDTAWFHKTQPHISAKFFYLGFDGRDDKWHTPGCTSSDSDNCYNIRVTHLHPAGLGQYSEYSKCSLSRSKNDLLLVISMTTAEELCDF